MAASTSLLNRKATRAFILAKFQSMRPGMPITRVSQLALDILETEIRNRIVLEVRRHPSRGKTFEMPRI